MPYAKRLAEAIKAGEWRLNGETIKINSDGGLEDGQHRCMAVVLAGVGIWTIVAKGLPPGDKSFETIDRGKSRTNADMFYRAGEDNHKLISSALSWLWRWERCDMNDKAHAPRWEECRKLLNDHGKLRDSLTWGHKAKKTKILLSSMAVCLHYLFAKIDVDDADFFFEHLISGENLSKKDSETSAIYVLRARLQVDLAGVVRMKRNELFKLVIKGWNAFRGRQVIRSLRVEEGEDVCKIE